MGSAASSPNASCDHTDVAAIAKQAELALECPSPLTCWMWQTNKSAKNDYSQAARSQSSVLSHHQGDGQQSPCYSKTETEELTREHGECCRGKPKLGASSEGKGLPRGQEMALSSLSRSGAVGLIDEPASLAAVRWVRYPASGSVWARPSARKAKEVHKLPHSYGNRSLMQRDARSGGVPG